MDVRSLALLICAVCALGATAEVVGRPVQPIRPALQVRKGPLAKERNPQPQRQALKAGSLRPVSEQQRYIAQRIEEDLKKAAAQQDAFLDKQQELEKSGKTADQWMRENRVDKALEGSKKMSRDERKAAQSQIGSAFDANRKAFEQKPAELQRRGN